MAQVVEMHPATVDTVLDALAKLLGPRETRETPPVVNVVVREAPPVPMPECMPASAQHTCHYGDALTWIERHLGDGRVDVYRYPLTLGGGTGGAAVTGTTLVARALSETSAPGPAPGKLSFRARDALAQELLRIAADGRIYVRGRLVETDKDIADAIRSLAAR